MLLHPLAGDAPGLGVVARVIKVTYDIADDVYIDLVRQLAAAMARE